MANKNPEITQADAMLDEMSRKELDALMSRKMHEAAQRKRAAAKRYSSEPTRTVIAAPSYAKWWGKTLEMSINGTLVTIAVNGKPHNIPVTFADDFDRKREAIDVYESYTSVLEDVSSNYDGVDNVPTGAFA